MIADSPEYYDLEEDLYDRICEENEGTKEDKVCCSKDDKVGHFCNYKNNQFKLTVWKIRN